jgi:hypothetical protein
MAWYEQSRLLYVRDYFTRGEIQSITGLHWKTQEAVIAGTIDLIPEWKNEITQLYTRTVYGNLRDVGMSVSQASRFRNYAVDAVYDIQSKYQGVLDQLAMESTAIRIAAKERRGIEVDYDEQYEASYNSMKYLLSQDPRSAEDILETPTVYR